MIVGFMNTGIDLAVLNCLILVTHMGLAGHLVHAVQGNFISGRYDQQLCH